MPIDETFGWLTQDLSTRKKDCPRTLIFCSSIKICADIYTAFLMVLDNSVMEFVNMFHSCTSENVKETIREDMNDDNGHIRVLIATSAAGMGVNYKNNVVHYSPLKDMDSFVQQLGRAGRDGSQSLHLLLYNSIHTHNLEADMKTYIENKDKCRRLQILESYDSLPNVELENIYVVIYVPKIVIAVVTVVNCINIHIFYFKVMMFLVMTTLACQIAQP